MPWLILVKSNRVISLYVQSAGYSTINVKCRTLCALKPVPHSKYFNIYPSCGYSYHGNIIIMFSLQNNIQIIVSISARSHQHLSYNVSSCTFSLEGNPHQFVEFFNILVIPCKKKCDFHYSTMSFKDVFVKLIFLINPVATK